MDTTTGPRASTARIARRATATFTLAGWTPSGLDDEAPPLGAVTATKTFTGDLAATSTVHLLTAGDPATGNAGYVGMERVSGSLHGAGGGFIVQHSATSAGGSETQQLTIVPGSGTGELAGIAGSACIDIDTDSGHTLRLDYTIG